MSIEDELRELLQKRGEVDPSANLRQGLYRKIHALEQRPKFLQWLDNAFKQPRLASAVAMLCIFLVGSFAYLRYQQPHLNEPEAMELLANVELLESYELIEDMEMLELLEMFDGDMPDAEFLLELNNLENPQGGQEQ